MRTHLIHRPARDIVRGILVIAPYDSLTSLCCARAAEFCNVPMTPGKVDWLHKDVY